MLTFNFNPFPILETERLLMRRVTFNDKDDFFKIRTNPIVNRYIDRAPMQRVDEAVEFIQKIVDGVNKNEMISWAITLKGNNQMIGTIDFWRIMREHHRAEIGYVLDPEFHRKGVMHEAMATALDYGFTVMKLHSVEANVNPENNASRRLLEKNGFVQEAYFRENYYYDGKFLDSVIYSLITTNGD